jgi:hypothetical protein
MLILEE